MEGVFKIVKPIQVELKEFQDLRSSNPEMAREIFEYSESLVMFASQGAMRKMISHLQVGIDKKIPILSPSIISMIKTSLINGHFMVTTFIIANGFPITSPFIPSVFHDSLAEMNDFQGVQLIEFLIRNNIDINMQASGSWLTFLHIAIQKQMIATIQFLLENNADINAVAKDDILPLNCAEALPIENSRKKEIIDLLLQKGARREWKNNRVRFSGEIGAAEENTNVSTKSGSMTTTRVRFTGGYSPIELPDAPTNIFVQNSDGGTMFSAQ